MAGWRPSPDAPIPPPKSEPAKPWRPSPYAPPPPPKPQFTAHSPSSSDVPFPAPEPNLTIRLIQSSCPPIPPPKDNQHSTLEVDVNRWLECDGKSAPAVGHDPRGAHTNDHHDEKMTAYSHGKITNYSDLGKQAIHVNAYAVESEPEKITEEPKMSWLRSKKFYITFLLIMILITAASIGGGVGGTIDASKKNKPTSIPKSSPAPTRQMRYSNTGLAAIQWTDLNATLHKRVYYQDSSNKIRESGWDNSTAFDAAWQINTVGNAVKPGTPIAAAAGYPHASYNYSLVKDVFFLSNNNGISARQAPSNNSQAWVDDNFSGLYTGDNSTFLSAYWNQNIQNVSQELVLLFQQGNFANGLSQARYVSNKTTSNPWVVNNFGFSQPRGSTFAMSPISYVSGKHLMLYTVGDSNTLQQHEYTISDTDLVPSAIVSLTSETSTGLNIQPQSPLTVVSQDNQPLYTQATLPECTHGDDLRATNLILFASPDDSSLILNAWNCSSGYSDHTPEIQPLQKANTTYLSLTSTLDKPTGNGSVYILFDSGSGPQIEEWIVPKRAGDPWSTSRKVSADFGP